MNDISNNVSEQLENAAQEALQQLDPFHQLMNAGAEYERVEKSKPKLKRKVRAKNHDDNSILKCNGTSHIIATVEWDKDEDDTTEIPMFVEIPDSILVDDYNLDTIANYLSDVSERCHKGFDLSWPDYHETHEQFCQWEIEKAHIYEKTEPDFDYRLLYQKGDKVYLVRYYDTLNIKEMVYMSLRTIYARMMVGVIDKQGCQCVDINDRDNIFCNRQDAMNYFNSIQAGVSDEYNEDTGKKKRKRKNKDTEEDDESEFDMEEEYNE